MNVQSCVPRRTAAFQKHILATNFSKSVAGQRRFHPSPPIRAELPNHYATLDISPNASAGEIKKQFYKLSKSHHPDLHPNDPTASQKFVRISEAYATLSSPDKRSRYDREIGTAQQSSSRTSPSHPQGSYSSSGPGGRPASGLSRRRTQFRGPPPSFYRSGGWGAHGDKRGEAASKASHTHEAQGRAQSNNNNNNSSSSYSSGDNFTGSSGGAGAEPGMGPGGFAAGFDDDVPHFDRRAHAQTHSEIERTRHRARRRRAALEGEEMEGGSGGSVLFNFLMITGMLGVIFGATRLVLGAGSPSTDGGKKKSDGEG